MICKVMGRQKVVSRTVFGARNWMMTTYHVDASLHCHDTRFFESNDNCHRSGTALQQDGGDNPNHERTQRIGLCCCLEKESGKIFFIL
jgi:hypothetical protein